MALSMFLRAPACTSRLFTQQVMRYATQQPLSPAVTQRAVASLLSIQNNTLKSENTPIFNAVRSLRTSAVQLQEVAEKPHDHAKLWVIEKVTSAVLVPLIPIALIMPNKLFDSLLAIIITAHSFWGMEAIVVEYLRVILVGPTVPRVAMGVVYFLTVLMLGGMLYLINNDIGGLEAIAVDYVRASIFGPIIPKIAIALVYLLSIATLGGLFYVIMHDIGIANCVRRLWAVKSEKA
ncbi:uncharacterized protein SdhD [Epargyreus clarus]|uniref:uncharacterized protein SdhD n=1 Tax=Epargyreus clarus TaxID=520877 RepID=UPI003C2ABED4